MDRLDELSVLLAILEAGSLAAAGRRLRRSPAAMTRTLTQLEQRIGARLVDRTTRVLPGGRHRAPRVRAFVEHAAERLRTLPVVAPEGSR